MSWWETLTTRDPAGYEKHIRSFTSDGDYRASCRVRALLELCLGGEKARHERDRRVEVTDGGRATSSGEC